MAKQTSIELGSHFDRFIDEQVSSGRYESPSDTIRAALRLLESEETQREILRKALIEGEQSGRSDYSLNAVLEELHQDPN